MYEFYISTSQWSSFTKIRLIQLGFIHLLIHENVFLGCNHILTASTLFTLEDYIALTVFSRDNNLVNYQTKLITSMNTPSKMKILLDNYPQIDLTELTSGNSELYQQRTPLTIFDRLLKMEIFYYETIEQTPLIDIPNFTSDQTELRTTNILYLFQKLLCHGAKVIDILSFNSIDSFSDSSYRFHSMLHSIKIIVYHSIFQPLVSIFYLSFVFVIHSSYRLSIETMTIIMMKPILFFQ